MPFEAELYNSELGQGLAIVMPLLDTEVAEKYDDSTLSEKGQIAATTNLTFRRFLNAGTSRNGEVIEFPKK